MDYCVRTLYLKANAPDDVNVYVSDITGINHDNDNPLSSAIRAGFVVYGSGNSETVENEFIFEIDDTVNPQGQFNTFTDLDYKNRNDIVLDSSKTDGTTVYFTALNQNNYAEYDEDSGEVTLKDDSAVICTLQPDGTPTRVDVYFWLEGCDRDCYGNLAGQSLDSISLGFAGVVR